MIELTAGVNINSVQIEQAVTKSPPVFLKMCKHSVEFATGFPNIMLTLWGFIVTYRNFPSQQQFVDYYLRVHSDALYKLDQGAVKARVLRAYPSLTREIHFYSLAKESGHFDEVVYSAQMDVEMGTDLLVTLGGHTYNIACYVLTKRAVEFRQRKRSSRHEGNQNSIELPLDLTVGKQTNGWTFFDQRHVDILLYEIINFAWQNYAQHPLELIS